jgi:hypothetical protein
MSSGIVLPFSALVVPLDIDLIGIPVEGGQSELIVPDEFFAYRALDVAVRVSSDAGRSLFRFGTIGSPGPIGVAVSVFVDEESGVVVSGIEPDDVIPVNTSLGLFVDCVRRLAEIFPFCSEDSDYEEWEAGAQRVQEVICEIDAAAYQEGAYWYEFRWDVSMGEFHG